MFNRLKSLREFGDFIFPSACRICRARLPKALSDLSRAQPRETERPKVLSGVERENSSETNSLICEACEKTSSRLTAPFCAACRQVLPEGLEIYRKTEGPERSRGAATGSPCPSCAKPESIPIFAFGLFDPFNRELLHRLKYYGDRPTGEFLGNNLGNLIFSLGNGQKWDAVIPVPLHWTRKWSRGFNQSFILAKSVSKALGVPVLSALRRVKRTKDQTRLSREERLANVRGAFRLIEKVRGKKLLLLDDVSTTGATLEECRKILKEAGAAEISAAVVALANDN